jgi:hypothetical protein
MVYHYFLLCAQPAYQNLRKRVDQTLESFIRNREWKPTLNKNQLRNQLKAEIQVTNSSV